MTYLLYRTEVVLYSFFRFIEKSACIMENAMIE